jgi:hypothetical protein
MYICLYRINVLVLYHFKKGFIMYYTITNTISTEVSTPNGILVCGQCYSTKTKAPKDGDELYAFSKAENPVDGLVWRFDGKADIDAELFIEEVDQEDRDIMAWKTARIDIQAKIRPSKDSKKAIAQLQRTADISELEKLFADGEIDAAEFGKRAIAIAAQL